MMVGDVMETGMGTKRAQGEYNGVWSQGNTRGHTCYGTTAVKYDMVMASCIDGPSHKWAVLLEVSHDMVPIAGSHDCAVTPLPASISNLHY